MKRNRKIIHYSKRYSKKARTKRFILKVLLTILILAAMASVGLIITGYLVDDPSNDSLSSQPISSDQNSSEENASLPQSKPDSSSSEEISSEQPTSSEEEPIPQKQTVSVAVKMSGETLLSKTERAAFLKKAAENGCEVVVFEAKNTKGKLSYASSSELATRCGAIIEGAVDLGEVIAEIHAAGLKAAPYLSALQDPIAAHTDYKTSYRYGNTEYTWLDNAANKGGKAWLNPYLENTRNYLTEIIQELSDAGSDLIYVDKMRYPTAYTSKLNQGSSTVSRQDMLSQLAETMSSAAACEVVFCFDAESYFGKNTSQYNGNPSGIKGIAAVAPQIDLTDFDGISEAFSGVDLSVPTVENLKLILDEVRALNPNATLYPIISTETVSEELISLFTEYGITTIWTK